VSKNPYEIKVRGLVSNREGVKHSKRHQYSEGASCLCLHTQKWNQNHVVHLKKLFGELG